MEQDKTARRGAASGKSARDLSKVPYLGWTRYSRQIFQLAFLVLAAFLIIREIVNPRIVIEPIPVPEVMDKNGMTAEVVSMKLRDTVNSLAKQANTHARYRAAIDSSDAPDIEVPNVGISARALAAQIGRYVGISRQHDITGDCTLQDGKIFLEVRMDGTLLYASKDGASPNHMRDEITAAAEAVLKQTQPYVYAVYLKRLGKLDGALAVIEQIIRNPSSPRDEVKWAHNFKGNILEEQSDYPAALNEFQIALEMDKKFAVAYAGRGNVELDTDRNDDAIKDFRKAISLDSSITPAYDGLGEALLRKRQVDDADKAFQAAFALDPNDFFAHRGFAGVLVARDMPTEAIAEYQLASDIDPADDDVKDRIAALRRSSDPSQTANHR